MTLLAYTKHLNVVGARQTIDYIRQFAVAQGWTQEQWQDGYRWDMSDPYGWIADSDHAYLCLSSTGYGTQSLIARIQSHPNNGSPGMYVRMSSNTTITVERNMPYHQNSLSPAPNNDDPIYTAYEGMHVGNAAYDELYIFGNDKFICAVLNMDGVFCQALYFGTHIMLEANPSQGQTHGQGYIVDYDGDHRWYNWRVADSVYTPWWPGWRGLDGLGYLAMPTMDIYYNSREQMNDNSGSPNISRLRHNMAPYDAMGSDPPDDIWSTGAPVPTPYLNLGQCIAANSFSGKRPMMRITYFIEKLDSTWQPVCQSHWFFVRFEGLQIGEILSYGPQQYMVLPVHSYSQEWGVAFRIA